MLYMFLPACHPCLVGICCTCSCLPATPAKYVQYMLYMILPAGFPCLVDAVQVLACLLPLQEAWRGLFFSLCQHRPGIKFYVWRYFAFVSLQHISLALKIIIIQIHQLVSTNKCIWYVIPYVVFNIYTMHYNLNKILSMLCDDTYWFC